MPKPLEAYLNSVQFKNECTKLRERIEADFPELAPVALDGVACTKEPGELIDSLNTDSFERQARKQRNGWPKELDWFGKLDELHDYIIRREIEITLAKPRGD